MSPGGRIPNLLHGLVVEAKPAQDGVENPAEGFAEYARRFETPEEK